MKLFIKKVLTNKNEKCYNYFANKVVDCCNYAPLWLKETLGWHHQILADKKRIAKAIRFFCTFLSE